MRLNFLTHMENMSPQARSGYQTSLIFLFGAGLAIPLYAYLAVQAGDWQLYIGVASAVLVTVAAGAGVRLCRQNQSVRAMWGLIGAILLAGGISSAVFAGLGLFVGLIVFAFLLQISTQAMPSHLSSRILFIGILAGGGMAILDLIALPIERYDASAIRQLTLIATGVIIVVQTIRTGSYFLSYPLGIKLTLSFLAVSFVSLALIALVSFYIVRNSLVNGANQVLTAAATQTARDIDSFIVSNKDAVRVESQLPDLAAYLSLPAGQRAGSPEEAETLAILRALSRKSINISSYALLSPQGISLLDTNTPDIGRDYSQEVYFLTPYNEKLPYVSEVLFSKDFPGTPSLYFSNAVSNSAGQVLGVLLVRYNATVLQQIINESTGLVGERSFAILFDENHIRLADGDEPELAFTLVGPRDAETITALQTAGSLPPGPTEELTTDLPDFDQALNNAINEKNFAASAHPGEEASPEQGAIAFLENNNWLVAVVQDQAVFLAPVTQQTQTTLSLTLVITALVVGAALVVAQVLAGPIVRLTAVAEEVAAGNLQVVAPVESNDEIGALATTFNSMTAQLATFISSLEQRVADRTKALSTSLEISRSLSTILNQKQLVSEVVEQVQTAFNYYHVQIYLSDAEYQHLVMVGGTGRAGQTMLTNRHVIAWGKGLVGRAAATNNTILVPDVTQDAGWLPNPLLPETQSEIAVPIATGNQVLGVLDVQHRVANGLTQEDSNLLQSIANQIVIALQNARLLEQVQRRAEREAMVNTINQKIQRATSVEGVLQVASQELGKALGTQSSTIQLGAWSLQTKDTPQERLKSGETT